MKHHMQCLQSLMCSECLKVSRSHNTVMTPVWRTELNQAEESAADPGAWDDDLAGNPGSGELPDIVELRPEEAVRSLRFCPA